MSKRLTDFTFSSGIKVQLRRLTQLTLTDIRAQAERNVSAQTPKPTPPLQTVTWADGTEKQEPNSGEPGYLRSLSEWDGKANMETIRLMSLMAVKCEIDAEALADVREAAKDAGVELDDAGSDKWAYLKHVAISSTSDLVRMQSAIIRSAAATEEQISAEAESFKSDVSREAARTVLGAAVGNTD